MSIKQWLYLFVALAGLTLFTVLGQLMVTFAPEVTRVKQIEIRPVAGQMVEIGRESLGLPGWDKSTAQRHLGVTNDQGQWRFYNLSAERKVDIRTDSLDTLYVRRWALNAGDRIQIEARYFEVVSTDNSQLVLSADDGEILRWQDMALHSDRQPNYEFCRYNEGVVGSLKAGFRHFALTQRWNLRRLMNQASEIRLFSLGGQVACDDRWKLAELPLHSATVWWRDGHFWIGNFSANLRVRLFSKTQAKGQLLSALSVDLAGDNGRVNRLILGHTGYRVSFDSSRLILAPNTNQTLHLASADKLESCAVTGVTCETLGWIGQGDMPSLSKKAWVVLGVLLVLSGILAVFLAAIGDDREPRPHWVKIWCSTLPAWLFIGLILPGGWSSVSVNLGAVMLLTLAAWLFALVSVFAKGFLQGWRGLLFILVMLLAGIGALVLLQLAAGASNTKWLKYALNHLRMLILLGSLLGLMVWFSASVWRNLVQQFVDGKNGLVVLIKYGALCVIIGLLMMQFFSGGEGGLGFLQPVEFAKLAMIMLLAAVLTEVFQLRRVGSQAYFEQATQLILFAGLITLLFAFSSTVMMLGVNDNSPVVIVIFVSLPFLWVAMPHPRLAHPKRTFILRFMVVGLPLMLILLGGAWLWHYPPDYLSAIPQADRFRVWSDPWANRFSGEQLIKSFIMLHDGAWTGVSHWFGLNGKVMSLPAVQDDFIAGFMLNRFGGLAGLLLIGVQVLWSGVLMLIGLTLMNRFIQADTQTAFFWLGGVLFGLAWMHLIHWFISWGNVSGLLPVMGQPMTWLSSGNSHMLAIALPSVILGFIGAWILDEEKSPRVRSAGRPYNG